MSDLIRQEGYIHSVDRPGDGLEGFFARFLGWSLLLQVLVWAVHETPQMGSAVQNTLAQLSATFYSFFSNSLLLVGNQLIDSESGRFVIVGQACTGLSLTATLLAGLFALPGGWFLRVCMGGVAVILIQLQNTVRIAHLFHEAIQPVNHFDLYHLYVWQLLNLITALTVFYLLSRLLIKQEASTC